jgi:Prefoldin subunit
MVEYSYDEAIELLETQLAQTHSKIEEFSEDMFYIRGNSITVEVSMARLFNHGVKMKKIKEASEAAIAVATK